MISRSSELFARARSRIPGGVNSPVRAFRNVDGAPFFVARAKGAKIWDVDGKEYIDYVGSWGPAILGHAPGVVVNGVREAATRGLSFGIPNPLEVEMAELICDWMPSIEKVRMVNSGTEATMSCIRLARAFTGRDRIIKFDGCYHGHVDGLLVKTGSGALTHGQPDSAGVPKAFADLTISLPFNNADVARKAFAENKGKIAAVIVEPVPANAGLYLPSDDFLSMLRNECASNGALLIFDEVITGFRLARGGAQEIYGVKPDLTALGKVIGGGLPVGAFGGRPKSWTSFRPMVPCIRRGRCLEILWRWPQVSRNCASSNGSTDGNCSKNLARNSRDSRGVPSTMRRSTSRLTGSVRCFVCSSPRGRLSMSRARGGAI